MRLEDATGERVATYRGEDINLRLNAAIALGNICASPPPPKDISNQTVISLNKVLMDEENYMPRLAAEALGRIGNNRAVAPLAVLLADRAKDRYTREEAAKSLGIIGGREARAALMQAREECEDEDLIHNIDGVLDRMNTNQDRQ